MTYKVFNRFANWLPIKPLTGAEDEWEEPWGDADDEHLQQNKRCGHVFRKNFDNKTAYNSRGRAFVHEDGCVYVTSESSIPIAFPYEVPDKPEYVYEDGAHDRT